MEHFLLIILGVILLDVALLYYMFIVKRYQDLALQGRASIFIQLFVITPVILIVLLNQSGAEYRLNKAGFNPHPEFCGTVGVAAGMGENPTWLFSIDSDIASTIQFYRDRKNRKGWTLSSENKNMLVFIKDDKKMSILINSENVAFSLTQ